MHEEIAKFKALNWKCTIIFQKVYFNLKFGKLRKISTLKLFNEKYIISNN